MNDIYGIFFEPAEVTEVRALGLHANGPWQGWARDVVFGYFNDGRKLSAAVEALAKKQPRAVYFVANPVLPALLARANNRLIAHADKTPLTRNNEIVCLRWAMIDLDPRRPSGIPSTNDEMKAAYVLADKIIKALERDGLHVNVKALSGNGVHLFLRFDPPVSLKPHTEKVIEERTAPLRAFLAWLAEKYNTEEVEIDQAVYKPVQLARYYGTKNRKGDGTPERPHRESRIIKVMR
jgi:hypothetical protein